MSGTILVVDDLLPNVKLLEIKLTNEFYNVICARSGQEALDILEKNKDIDLILLDVMMPEMDGFEACMKIKANPKTSPIPVIMVTALTELEDRIKGLESGADEFLTKPVKDIELMARVKSLSRMKLMIDELVIRNKVGTELGLQDNSNFMVQNFTTAKIVIINDNVTQTQNLMQIVSNLTPNVIAIEKDFESEDTINKIVEYAPDLVIMNSEVNYINSLKIFVKIKGYDQLKYCAFLLFSEDDNFDIIIKGLEIGINDYFMWPVDANEMVARMKTQLRRKFYHNSLRLKLEMSVDMAIKDGLTNIYNRRYFDLHMEQILSNISNIKNLTLLMVDIDFFKKINDNYGHQAGDKVLKEFAQILIGQVRVTDLVARYGGEEFVIILNDSNLVQSKGVAERIRKKVENSKFSIGADQEINVTCSIGVAQYHTSITNLVELADNALYMAKESGRNQVLTA